MKSITAIKIMLTLLSAVVLFHFAILVKLIPYDITWGGRLKTDQEMYVFESLSIIMNLFLILVLLVKGSVVRFSLPMKFVNVVLWIFLVLFALNTLGNAIAETQFEKSFAIITALSSVLLWFILRAKKAD